LLALEVVLGVLDLVGVVLVVVVGVNIKVGDVVTEISHVLLAARFGRAAGVRRAHVSGNLANNVAKSHLVLPHLLLAVDGGNRAQIQMRPGVGRNLVTLGVHALDNTDKLSGGVDFTLVDVVARDEESGLSVVCLENIQNVRSESLLWAIVVGQSNRTGGDAVVDTSTTILNGANLGTGDGRGVGASRSDVLGATRAVLVVATRGVAVVVVSAAVYLLLVSQLIWFVMGSRTSSTRAALSSGARSNSGTALAVILTGSQALLMSMRGADLSNASLEVGKQVTGLQVAHVDTSDLWKTHAAMGADQWGDSRNGGECGEVHVM
jgi:hypothetical protein